MLNDTVTHYYPNAMLVFVSGFQGDANNKNTYIVSNLSKEGDDKGKLIQSISVELTVRNNPGTFNAVIFHTGDQLMLPDEPETEIPILYKYSQDKQIKFASTNVAKDTLSRPVNKEDELENGNYYEYKNYDTWLEDENIVLEDGETGDRYPLLQYINQKKAVTYWTFDFAGNIIKIPNTIEGVSFSAVEDGKTINLTYTGDRGKKTKKFTIHRFKNKLFVDTYKDTVNQGIDRKIFKNGRCRIKSMDRIIVFMSERFTTNKQPGLIRCFTGVVNNVEEGYTEGKASITISGEDVTKFMKISLVNVNPALLLSQDTDVLQTKDQHINIWTDIFKDMTTPNIIKLCTVGARAGTKGFELIPYSIDGIGTYTLSSPFSSGMKIKFSQDDNSWIKIYKDGNQTKASLEEILGALFQKNTVHICDPYTNNSDLMGFRPYPLSIAGSWSFYQGDWKTKREIAYRASEDSHFVFYADRNGEIWFHPPRFSNSWILGASNPNIYIIDTPSIISYGFVESDENIYTVAFVSTEPPFGYEGVKELGFFDKSFRDDGAVLKYGFRVFTSSNPVINLGNSKKQSTLKTAEDYARNSKNQSSIIVYAKSLLQRLLAQKYQGQIVITGRPEIDPGRPVYIPFRNMIYYVETVNHRQTAGGDYTTTLHLNYGRKPWEILPELLTMAEHDEIYMTDAALFSGAEVLTGSQRQQKRSPITTKKKLSSKGNDTSIQQNLEALYSNVIIPLGSLLGVNVTVTEDLAYRTSTTAHPEGRAADTKVEGMDMFTYYTRIKQFIRNGDITVDQCIYETTHVHLSYSIRNNRNEIRTLVVIDGQNTYPFDLT